MGIVLAVYGILVLIFLSIPILTIWWFYRNIKKHGYTIWNILGIFIFILIGTAMIIGYFSEETLSESSVETSLQREGIVLSEPFKILSHKSSWINNNYDFYFTIEVSEKDKESIISFIKNQGDFTLGDGKDLRIKSRDRGTEVTQAYESLSSYNYERIPIKQGNYAQEIFLVSLTKSGAELTFNQTDPYFYNMRFQNP